MFTIHVYCCDYCVLYRTRVVYNMMSKRDCYAAMALHATHNTGHPLATHIVSSNVRIKNQPCMLYPFIFPTRCDSIPIACDIFANLSTGEWPIQRWITSLINMTVTKPQQRLISPRFCVIKQPSIGTQAIAVTFDTLTGDRVAVLTRDNIKRKRGDHTHRFVRRRSNTDC